MTLTATGIDQTPPAGFFPVIGQWADRYFQQIIGVGFAPEDSDEERTRKSIMSLMAFMGFWAAIILGIHDVLVQFPTKGAITFTYAGLTILGFIHFSRTKNFRFFRFCQLALVLVVPFMAQFFHGGFSRAGASMVWALACPFCAVLFHGPQRSVRWFAGFLVLLAIAGLLENTVTNLPQVAMYRAKPLFFVAHIAGISTCLFILVQYFVFRLKAEQQRSEKLLLNILPAAIAQRLKKEGQTIADGFADVTILFADLAGFTRLSSQKPPEEIVQILNRVFSAFDQLSEKHGLEKIKTIGDAYMVVGGLPEARADHAEAVARFAFDMRESLRDLNSELGTDIRLRIGINSGPVVAGVIGLRKFIYDLWGDTVNVASRMESTGIEGEIQVTDATFALLRERFVLEERGLIQVKGKGELKTYLLRSPR